MHREAAQAITAEPSGGRPARAFAVLLGVILVGCTIWAVVDFPLWRLPLAIAFLLYAAALWRWPRIWLIVVPAALPVFDLMPWSGRFFLTEFDMLILVTLAVIGLRGAGGRMLPGLWRAPWRLPALMALSYAISTVIPLLPLPPLELASFNSYLSPFNSLRVAKGFFWAWLLTPALVRHLHRDPQGTRDYLVAGIVTGLALAGIGILWERGVFVDLATAGNIYGLLNNLLDFSGSYRATGLFSGMHVGGEAIDGYLSLAVPFSLYPVLFGRRLWVRIAGLAVFALGTYGVMVTFSRGLYAGYGISLAVMLALLVARNLTSVKANLIGILATLAAVALYSWLFVLLYRHGGFEPLVVAILILGASTILIRFAPVRLLLPALALTTVIAVAGGFRIHDGLLTSKWTDTGSGTAIVLAIAAATAGALLPMLLARRLFPAARPFSALAILFLAALFWLGTIPPVTGYQAQSRFATVERDLNTRQEHWQRSLAAMDPSLPSRIFGMGTGSFPELFFSAAVNTGFPLATYHPVREGDLTYLRLGGGDFNLIQRLKIDPGKTYRLEARIRPEVSRPIFAMKICHKHILYSERWVPDCRHRSRHYKRGEEDSGWFDFSGEIQSGRLGAHGALYWPTSLMLFNGRGIIHVTDVKVIDDAGRNLVANGDFAQGMDRWFLVSDFEHLAWHSKNMYLHLFIEQGGFGLIAFLVLVLVTLGRLVRAVPRGDPLAAVIAASLISFLAVGLFGTLLDMPRIATLFFLLVFAGHAMTTAKKT